MALAAALRSSNRRLRAEAGRCVRRLLQDAGLDVVTWPKRLKAELVIRDRGHFSHFVRVVNSYSIAFRAHETGFCCGGKKSLKFHAEEDRGPLKDLKPRSNILRFAFWKVPPRSQ